LIADSRATGTLDLAGGDGTYGELRYYLDGSWRHVCYDDSMDYLLGTVQDVCEQFGFM